MSALGNTPPNVRSHKLTVSKEGKRSRNRYGHSGRHLSGPPELMNTLENRVAGNLYVLKNAVHRLLIRPSTMPRLHSPRRYHVQI